MINFPTQAEIEELQAYDEKNCLTMYIPLIDPNAATNPNRIEIKNMLRQAEIAMSAAKIDEAEIRKTLRPAKTLIDSSEFWPMRHESLVLFMHAKYFRYYHIPGQFNPFVLTIQKGFDVAPLLELMQNNEQYYVLAIGHKNIRLYEGDHYSLTPVQVKNLPTDMKQSLHIDEYPQSRETHTIAPANSGKGSEAYHGQYNVAQTDKAMLREFFRLVDRALHNFLFNHQKPLILAGVTYLIPIYRKVNTYPGLLAGYIPGNQDYNDPVLLREKALQLVRKT